MIDFLVDSISEDGSVTGINCGEDIPVGFVFTAFEIRKMIEQEEQREPVGMRREERLFLRLESVQMYRKDIAVAPSGCSALLRVHGDGFRKVMTAMNQLSAGEMLSLTGME